MNNVTPNIPIKFIQDETGSATPLAIGFSVIFIVLGGPAVDYNKAMGERTQMQMAADSAAHAAAYSWEFQTTDTSTQIAMATTTGMLPDIAFRDALQPTDIEYGFWDPGTGQFTIDPTFEEDKDDPRRSAVRSFAELEPERANESRNIFLSMVGQDNFTIRVSSIYASYYPPCLNEGFVAEGVVDMQSNAAYFDGFCMHSNTYVSLNQNNFFEAGTVVSMPNLADLDIPDDGFEKNEGLQAALRTSKYRLRILRQLPQMFEALYNGETSYGAQEFGTLSGLTAGDPVIYPLNLEGNGNGAKAGYSEQDVIDALAALAADPTSTALDDITRYVENDGATKTLSPINFYPRNRIYRVNCTGNARLNLDPGTYDDITLITNCDVNMNSGSSAPVILDGTLIAAEGDVSASHSRLGLDDNCDPGGGAAIWTYSTFQATSGLEGYGAQILALGDIDFTANADGMEGVSFISGGVIDGTSNGNMGFCDGLGTQDFVAAPYFRMVN